MTMRDGRIVQLERAVILPQECTYVKLKEPAEIVIDMTATDCIVMWPKLDEYGRGANLHDALDDMFTSVSTFYEFLLNNEHKLSAGMRQTLYAFQEAME